MQLLLSLIERWSIVARALANSICFNVLNLHYPQYSSIPLERSKVWHKLVVFEWRDTSRLVRCLFSLSALIYRSQNFSLASWLSSLFHLEQIIIIHTESCQVLHSSFEPPDEVLVELKTSQPSVISTKRTTSLARSSIKPNQTKPTLYIRLLNSHHYSFSVWLWSNFCAFVLQSRDCFLRLT